MLQGAGVTVMTHGFNGNVDDWIIPMANELAGYALFPGADFSCYEVSITQAGTSASFLGGISPGNADSGEIFIKLDWSTLAGLGGASTGAVANAAVDALLSTGLIAETEGRPLAELPLHLVGHSRGGSVVTEMARLLGAQGVWVDQVTTLDPRPVPLFGDASVTTWSNVLYADNFWQMLGDGLFVPNGQSVFGAYNRLLTSLGGGYSSSHSDVHLWYHGTIDLATPATDTQAVITAAERSAWWTGLEMAGAVAGFHYSRIGDGDRLSAAEPAGAGNGRISDGFNKHWDLGGGLGANRAVLPANSGLWPNVMLCGRTGTGPVPAGGTFELALYYQSGGSGSGDVDVRTLLDPDANPWNGNGIEADQGLLMNTGTGAVGFHLDDVGIDPQTVVPGSYRVCVRIDDGVRTRFCYAPEPLVVTTSQQPPSIQQGSVEMTGLGLRFNVLASPGQEVVVEATTDLITWIPLQTRVFVTAVWEFLDADTASFPRRFYRPVLVP